VENGVEKIVGETLTVLVYQVPMHLDDAVGRAAGDGLQARAVGGVEFDGKVTVRLRQFGVKCRAGVLIKMC